MTGQHSQAFAVIQPKTRRTVRNPRIDQRPEQQVKNPDPHAAAPGGSKRFHIQKAGTNDHIAATSLHCLHQLVDFSRHMLPVSVDLHHILISGCHRKFEPGLHGAANSQVAGKVDHLHSGCKTGHF